MPLTEENLIDYRNNKTPKCPYCDHDIDIAGNELYELYNEGSAFIDCPKCSKEINVESSCGQWDFSTDESDE